MFCYGCPETNFGELNNSYIGRLCPKKRVSLVTVCKKKNGAERTARI